MTNSMKWGASLAILGFALSACAETDETSASATAQTASDTSAAPSTAATNSSEEDTMTPAILAPYDGPYGGVPAFDEVTIDQFEPGIKKAIAMALEELDAIANNDEPATFENTIVAMERQGAALNRASTYYGIWSSNLSSPEFQDIEERVDPLYAEYRSARIENEKLFERIAAVWNDKATLETLTPAEQRLTWDYYTDFVRSGAALDKETKERIGDINEELSKLYTKFSQNLLHDEEAYVTWLTEDQLGGLPDSVVDAAAATAADRGRAGEYAIANTRSSMEPFLTYSEDRKLREQVWRTYYDRGDNGDAYDNNDIIRQILRLRQERSRLQGYENFAERALEKNVAKTPENAMNLMMSVWPAAIARVDEEVADMQAIADTNGDDITIEPWDYRYYSEKVRKAKYDLDADEVKQYLQLENLREGMFWMAKDLYNLDFEQVDDVPVFHPDVRVWKVTRNGALQGLWYFDPYARAGKRSGAWMNDYRAQQKLDGDIKTLVSNNSNFVKGKPGEPVLISWDDATTLFHEFGHALHGLMSDVKYPSQSGTSVPRDYVEFPSQVHENWLATDEILSRFAKHVDTGETIPDELVAKIKNAGTFNQGFATTEYLASALIDMRLHTLADASDVDPDAFERETLASLGMPSELPMRHRTPQFAHVFSGEGYAAGYYAYLWADTFGADAWEAFEEAGSPFDDATAQRFIDHVLSVGDTVDPSEGYKAFRGKELDTKALMRQRGFPTE
ncbi:M3 family metallopeptidase [Parvularcula sp. LCG005]|uniref:M3 family metallopeptidase n=1 Tax=Parvularcula sp. LCG005 TaxID=3078805 RepID=UPI002943B79A|nr:M3 family metallopeptidase [Parvularcula sp. LCG005]WOI54233.1 M3 family metallopeptidase [Parvularcula sp. LCG005]